MENQVVLNQNSFQIFLEEEKLYGLPVATSTPKYEADNSFELSDAEDDDGSISIPSYTSYEGQEDSLIKVGCQEIIFGKPLQTSTPKRRREDTHGPESSNCDQLKRYANNNKKCLLSTFEISASTSLSEPGPAVKRIKSDQEHSENHSVSGEYSFISVDSGSTSHLHLNTTMVSDSDLSLSILDQFDTTEADSRKFVFYFEKILLARIDYFLQMKQWAIYEKVLRYFQRYIDHCSKNIVDFVGSFSHLECERLRILTEKLMGVRDATQPISIQGDSETELKANLNMDYVTISVKKTGDTEKMKTTHLTHYLLLFRCNRTVLASNVAQANDAIFIKFVGPYIFRNISREFSISIELYSINVPLNPDNQSLPKMKIMGETVIDISNASTERFTFIDASSRPIGKLTSSVELNIIYPEEITGVFTVDLGDSHPAEQKRCVLRNEEIFQFVSPDDNCMAIRSIASLKTITIRCKVINFLTQKGLLSLNFKDNGRERTITLTSENKSDLAIWENRINLVCDTLAKWNHEF
ncbi:hypothetical protein GWI33_006556 [Rhynchophorus ferrugineus]|uniref:Anillin homology domain-containing protein n=1 Tax=Rhynchophorus ferrugineus TaxID=354439 RepID=A0A834ISH3_RHYFE|nr:hypothetical protein GWI33_006556 [Rhynchophorus ferrugineus]